MKPYISIIAAVDDFLGIGYQNKLPWKNAMDMKFFKEKTFGSIVVMGHNTWESLPVKNRPLIGRVNCVLTRNLNHDTIPHDGSFWFDNIINFLSFAEINYPDTEIYVIGGASIYKQFLDMKVVDSVILTRIHGVFNCDTYFPALESDSNHVWNYYVAQKSGAWERRVYTKHLVS